MSIRWTGELALDGLPVFRIGRDGDQLVAEWVGLCTLRSDRSGELVSFEARSGADERLLRKVRVGLGAALVAHLKGATSLHASAVATPDGSRAFAFLGRSGAGKSTLAAWMCRRRGYQLVSDDVVRVVADDRATTAVPNEREHWLDLESWQAIDASEEAANERDPRKAPLEATNVAQEPVPLVALVSLSYSREAVSSVTLEPLRGHQAMEALLPCLVRFVLDEPDRQLEELRQIEAMLSCTPFLELRAPRDLAKLTTVVDALEALR